MKTVLMIEVESRVFRVGQVEETPEWGQVDVRVKTIRNAVS